MQFKILLIGLIIVLLSSLLPSNIYFIFIFTLLGLILIPFKKYMDGTAILLVLFSFFYGSVIIINGHIESNFNLISYVFSPIVFYLFGKHFIYLKLSDNDRLKYMLFIVLAFMIPIFIYTIIDIKLVGLINPTRSMLSEINEGKSMAATLYGLNVSVGLGCASVFFLKKNKIIINIGYLIATFIAILTTIHLINRTGLVVFFICLFCNVIVFSKMNFKKMIMFCVIMLIVYFVISKIGIIDNEIIEAYSTRELDTEHGFTTGGGRVVRWSKSISNLIISPFGWERTFFSHNMWLDLARVGGWFAFIPFMIASFKIIKRSLIMVRTDNGHFSYVIFSIYISMMTAAFVEPVIEGSFVFFLFFMMIWGIISSLSKENDIYI